MADQIERPSQERLNGLPVWAQGYIRDLEFEVWYGERERPASDRALPADRGVEAIREAMARANGRLFSLDETGPGTV